MENEFQNRQVLCYSNFMKYTISFSIFNILLIIIENCTIIYSVDIMLGRDKILNELFTPFYFLSPHLYVEMLNEKLPNQCFSIFKFNTTNEDDIENNENNFELNNDSLNNKERLSESSNKNLVKKSKYRKKKKKVIKSIRRTFIPKKSKQKRLLDNESNSTKADNETNTNFTIPEEEEEEELDPLEEMYQRITEEPYFDIKFRGHLLHRLDNSYCVYNKNLIYISYAIVILLYVLLILLFFLNTRKHDTLLFKIIGYILTNLINIIIRPFFIAIVAILVNRPLLYLYRSAYMSSDYKTEEVIHMFLSLIFLIFLVVITYLIHDFCNNVFCFEQFPYDCFITGEENVLMFIKICIGFKITYDKIMGMNKFSVINLIVGLFVFYRLAKTFGSAKYVVNHIYLKMTRIFFSFFCCIFIVLKLMNQYLSYFRNFTTLNFVLEIIFIIFITFSLVLIFTPKIDDDFLFIEKEDLLVESLKFFYYVNRNFPTDNKLMKDKRKEKEEFVDKIIIGHKMKCNQEECIICNENIYNPDIKNLTLLIYSQFLECEKDFGEEEEGLALLIKLMFIFQIDNKKIHRLAFNILKNLKNQNLDGNIIIKMIYLYQKCLDRLNEEDPRGLLNVKHDEVNEELLRGIKNFEDILGYIRTRTEKVELVTNKTNSLGDLFHALNRNLFFLKSCKKYGYSMAKFLERSVLVRLLFTRQLDLELLENLDMNFIEFLEEIDKDYMDNITLMLKYDFNNKTWRIKNVPKRFIEHTHYSINELLEQPLDKIFPKVLAKSRIKVLEKEIVLANINDEKLEFKTEICDKETNIKSVKFIINIVPNLENNYSLYMRCHFYKRQMIIVDEFGNFMNGSDMLYEKAGINADIVAASKGRINIYSMFGLSKKQKLEDIKIVQISTENIIDVTRDLFLIENKNRENEEEDDYGDEEVQNMRMKATQTPMFLNTFLENQENQEKKKEAPKVILNLFNKELINDVNYYLFTVKLDEKKKLKKQDQLKGKSTLTPNENSAFKNSNIVNTGIKRNDLSDIKEEEFSEENPLKEGENDDDEKEEILDNEEMDIPKDENKNIDYNNYLQYYNNFMSQNSMSQDGGRGSMNSSINISPGSDIFAFLLMRSVSKELNTNKFEKLIYIICALGLVLILYGVSCIISLKIISGNSYKILDLLEDFNFMSLRIYKVTDLFFCYLKYFNYKENGTLINRENNHFNNYIRENLHYTNLSIDFDYLINDCLSYEANKSVTSTYEFNYNSYNYFTQKNYDEKINKDIYYIHLEPSGYYSIKLDKMKNILDLFTLTLNQISEKQDKKIYFNIKLMEYKYNNISALDSSLMTLVYLDDYSYEEKNQFNEILNLYQHLFNFYSSYVNTFDYLSIYLNDVIRAKFQKTHKINIIILLIALIGNIIFVLICFFSIVVYRKILKNEFTNLYGLSEDTISKLQEKFKYIKELIKREHLPSTVYGKIKKLREDIEAALMKEKIKKKKKEKKENDKLLQEGAGGVMKKNAAKPGLKRAQTSKSESLSVMTSGSQSNTSEYLQFSGAVKGLFRSSTLRATKQINKLNKEARKTKANKDLLDRLNFDFEIVKNFITFIVFMTIFYVILGIIVIVIIETNFDKVEVSLDYTNNFRIKYSSIFNFISSVKISIMTNKLSPYTIYNGTKTPQCTECVINILSNYTDSKSNLEIISSEYGTFRQMYEIENILEGEELCNEFYKNYENSWTNYLQSANSANVDQMINICNSISILKSNPDTIFSNLIFNWRRLYTYYLEGKFDLEKRKELLDNKFINNDLILIVFVYPYFEYLEENIISGMNNNVTSSYYVFMFIIFAINIVINILMMIFIWIKIYHQIIRSVENVQLVNDSISVV